MSTPGLNPDTMHVKVTVLAEADVGSMSVRPGPSTVTVSGPSAKYQQARELSSVGKTSHINTTTKTLVTYGNSHLACE